MRTMRLHRLHFSSTPPAMSLATSWPHSQRDSKHCSPILVVSSGTLINILLDFFLLLKESLKIDVSLLFENVARVDYDVLIEIENDY